MGAGRRNRARPALALALLLGAVLLPGVARAEVPPEARSLTVTPSTDLDDGQTVTVDGAGWRPTALIGVIECVAGTRSCGGAVANRPVGADGTFTVDLAVRTVFTAFDGTPVDCRVDACEVTAFNEENEDHLASAPIAFDPNTVLLPPPALTVTPDTNLVDGQTVAVAGTGFLPGVVVFVAQCPAGQTTLDGCLVYPTFVEADDAGAFAQDQRLSATFFTPDGTVDCRQVSCELVIGLFLGGVQGRAALTFDPDAPLLPPHAVTVTPDHDLVDGQEVAVRGTDFVPGVRVIVLQCGDTDALIEDCSLANHLERRVRDDGTFAGELPVDVTIRRLAGGTYDCAADPCVVRTLILGEEQTLDTPIQFAPGADGAPPPAAPVAMTPRFTG